MESKNFKLVLNKWEVINVKDALLSDVIRKLEDLCACTKDVHKITTRGFIRCFYGIMEEVQRIENMEDFVNET